jgi:hypothetical protein
LGPALTHREGRLGYHAWKQHTEFRSCERLRRKARQQLLGLPGLRIALRRIQQAARSTLSPLFRSTIGFDRLTRLVDAANRVDTTAVAYPPYNIEKTGEDA